MMEKYHHRDPKRIEPILQALKILWEQSPDMRLGQLFIGTTQPQQPCPELFYMEDDELLSKMAIAISGNEKTDRNTSLIAKHGNCHCMICSNEFVYIDENTLSCINSVLHPNFRSLQPEVEFDGQMMYPICPLCDAYALGADMATGFPFLTSSGEHKTIHDAS